jgi:hypothetical protein
MGFTGINFVEKETTETSFSIDNLSSDDVVFRIRVSISNILAIPVTSGTLGPSQSIQIPVSAKRYLPAEYQHEDEIIVKIAIDILPLSSDYSASGSRSFWQKHSSNALRKTVTCSIKRHQSPKGEADGYFGSDAKLDISASSEDVSVYPERLKFRGTKMPK